MSKSVSESRTAISRKKQKSHSNSLLDQKGGVTSQDQPDIQTVTESSAAVDTNMASLVKPQKRLKSKLIDRKGVTPKPSSNMKISPLLSTVGTVTLVKTDSVAMTASTNMLSDMTDSGDAGIHVPIVSTVDQIASSILTDCCHDKSQQITPFEDNHRIVEFLPNHPFTDSNIRSEVSNPSH